MMNAETARKRILADGIFRLKWTSLLQLLLLLLVAWILPTLVVFKTFGDASPPPSALRRGANAMQESRSAALLAEFFATFLRDQNIGAFLLNVEARYTSGTLCRLVESADAQVKRAAIMALGHIGSMDCNATIAKALRDPDPVARELAGHALWAIWFRADTDENNRIVEEIRRCNGQGQLGRSLQLANDLIKRSPDFAEAYNQRAIAHFFLNQYEESAADCQEVLKRNPYHFGALGGLAQTYLLLDRKADALEAFRRAARLQPYDQNLKLRIESLESE